MLARPERITLASIAEALGVAPWTLSALSGHTDAMGPIGFRAKPISRA